MNHNLPKINEVKKFIDEHTRMANACKAVFEHRTGKAIDSQMLQTPEFRHAIGFSTKKLNLTIAFREMRIERLQNELEKLLITKE